MPRYRIIDIRPVDTLVEGEGGEMVLTIETRRIVTGSSVTCTEAELPDYLASRPTIEGQHFEVEEEAEPG